MLAGAGKTRVLTTRFAHILLTGRTFPNQVLAVTFTNKAARDIQERVSAILGRPAEGLWLARISHTEDGSIVGRRMGALSAVGRSCAEGNWQSLDERGQRSEP